MFTKEPINRSPVCKELNICLVLINRRKCKCVVKCRQMQLKSDDKLIECDAIAYLKIGIAHCRKRVILFR